MIGNKCGCNFLKSPPRFERSATMIRDNFQGRVESLMARAFKKKLADKLKEQIEKQQKEGNYGGIAGPPGLAEPTEITHTQLGILQGPESPNKFMFNQPAQDPHMAPHTLEPPGGFAALD